MKSSNLFKPNIFKTMSNLSYIYFLRNLSSGKYKLNGSMINVHAKTLTRHNLFCLDYLTMKQL